MQSKDETLRLIAGHIEAREWALARALLEGLLVSGPQAAELYNDYGRVLNNLGELEGAAQAFASAVGLQQDHAEAHNNLGHVLRAQGDYARAEAHFSKAVALQPDYAKAHFNRASALNLLGRNEEAVTSLRAGLRLSSGDAMAHFNLATLYRFLDQYEAARRHFLEAMRLQANFVDAQLGLAGLQVHLHEIEDAMAAYQAVLDVDPESVEARVGIADIRNLRGERDLALASLMAEDGLLEKNPRLAVARASLEKNKGQHALALETLLAARERDPDACAQMPGFYYLLAEVYDKLGRYDDAMENCHSANRLKGEKFDASGLEAAIDSLIEVFSKEWFANAPRSGNDSQRPVFIVGMPRSGTSLVEQILASHPQVYGAGELNIIVDIVRELGRGRAAGYPGCMPELDGGALAGLSRRCLDAFERLNATAERVTDKLPHNFLHLGLISLILPDCKIIHCKRDYRDTALSCYFQNFSSASMAFTNSLEDIGAYFRQYLRLMAHWQETLDLSIRDLQYECLVANQEDESRRLVEFVGLNWDPACLKFHELDRPVNTASFAQVDQPMYATSVARYRNYEDYLVPLAGAIGKLP